MNNLNTVEGTWKVVFVGSVYYATITASAESKAIAATRKLALAAKPFAGAILAVERVN